MLQIRGAKGEAVLVYRKPLATKEMRYPQLSCMVNKMMNIYFYLDAHSVNSKITIHFYQILCYYLFIEHLIILFMPQQGLII